MRPAQRRPLGGGPASDPERARAEAGRRELRRYCAASRLNRLGTLTYRGEGCHDPRQARRDVGLFFRTLRQELDGKPLSYLWVPEWHKAGHGLQLHFAVGQFVPRRASRAAPSSPRRQRTLHPRGPRPLPTSPSRTRVSGDSGSCR
ncbi:rolling circle replication-associated protein [Janibacter melonis]|uniref:rolling circle replication-associated protein n=1 Tax=Janibacter melonis TaxID=262209 RepID=UPI003CD0890C